MPRDCCAAPYLPLLALSSHCHLARFVACLLFSLLFSNFKESLTLGRLHVRDVLADYPTVRAKLHKYNRWVFNTSVAAIIMQG